MSAPAVKHRPQITAQPQQTDSSRMRTSSRTTESSRMRGLRRNASSLIRATLPAALPPGALPPGALPGRTMRPGIARCCRPGGRTRRLTIPPAPTRSRAGERGCREPGPRPTARSPEPAGAAAAVPPPAESIAGSATARRARPGMSQPGSVTVSASLRRRSHPQSLTYSIIPPPADILRAIFRQIQETLARHIHLPRLTPGRSS
jgi:hypothetical protein